MKANPPENATRRIAVILGPGGSSRSLLDIVLPLLGRDRTIEMQGVFLEEAELKHAAELPFVKELCRVTFSVREFDSEQFDRVLALRMRTAQRALALLAKRAGVAHSFRNVRGSAASLLLETANQSDIMVFEPARNMAAAMSSRPYRPHSIPRIVVVLSDSETGSGVLFAALKLAEGDMRRVSVVLTPSVANDPAAVENLFKRLFPARPSHTRALPDNSLETLVRALRAEEASMLVLAATPDLMQTDALHLLRQQLRCPICLVRYWDESS